MGRHDSCGADLVNHCVNDILVQGARPLFFLDYVATGKVEAGVIEKIIEGIARGCRENRTALLGGETAEMPDFYAAGEYDVAGTIVGVVEAGRRSWTARVSRRNIAVGLRRWARRPRLYARPQSLFRDDEAQAQDRLSELEGRTIGDVLLDPHLSYLSPLEPLLDADLLHGMAHLTGAAFTNIPRVLPEGSTSS
jgi:phosphoribosylformylglycinamidine cyclo-ligase